MWEEFDDGRGKFRWLKVVAVETRGDAYGIAFHRVFLAHSQGEELRCNVELYVLVKRGEKKKSVMIESSLDGILMSCSSWPTDFRIADNADMISSASAIFLYQSHWPDLIWNRGHARRINSDKFSMRLYLPCISNAKVWHSSSFSRRNFAIMASVVC